MFPEESSFHDERFERDLQELLETFVTQEGDMMAFLELGGLDAAVRAMRRDSEYIRSSCCKLLVAASRTPVVCDAIVQVDGVAMLLLAMKEHPKCAAVHQYAAAALANMVSTHEVCLQVADPPEMDGLDGLKLLFTSLKTFKAAREVLLEVSAMRRSPCPLSSLTLGVKCGTSDATSGIAGNPTVGAVFDALVAAGGTAFFSETTEIIGAEDLVAARGRTPAVSQAILDAARHWEEKAKSTGEDIRAINPIPANIAAGITTLEEKSLGAIAKSGHAPIEGVLSYAERPAGHGLYFVDSWMSSLSLPLCFTACGAAIVIYQMGGGAMPQYPMMPAINPTVVSPFLYVTGNALAYARSPDNFDFDSSKIMTEGASIEKEGERLLAHLLDVASGTMTKMETLDYAEQLELYMEGPVL